MILTLVKTIDFYLLILLSTIVIIYGSMLLVDDDICQDPIDWQKRISASLKAQLCVLKKQKDFLLENLWLIPWLYYLATDQFIDSFQPLIYYL